MNGARVPRELTEGLKDYNSILRKVRGLPPYYPLRCCQRLASKMYQRGVDPNSVEDIRGSIIKYFEYCSDMAMFYENDIDCACGTCI